MISSERQTGIQVSVFVKQDYGYCFRCMHKDQVPWKDWHI